MIKYDRGRVVELRDSHALAPKMNHQEKLISDAMVGAALSENLLLEQSGFFTSKTSRGTYEISQEEIKESLDRNSADKIFSLDLPYLGPYRGKYSLDGRFVLLAGRKGHVALFNWKTSELLTELELRETVRDISFLHNETLFAVAQKEFVFIYDCNGIEIHRLKQHSFPTKIDFLPYHFLLVSVDKTGSIRWQDTSTGEFVAENNTRLGRCEVLAQNRHNAIMFTGHQNGMVCLWSPNLKDPVVKFIAQRGNITDVAVSYDGNYLATVGMDNLLKIWDLRNNYSELTRLNFPKSVDCLDWSQKGILACGFDNVVQLWNHRKLYMEHTLPKKKEMHMSYQSNHITNKISSLKFCPFEDFLGIGYSNGFSSIVVPGSGEPNIDTSTANPYQTKSQRRETTVARLLEKIPADMITLDPREILIVVKDPYEILEKKKEEEFNRLFPGKAFAPSNKMRGRNSASSVQGKKQKIRMERKTNEFELERWENAKAEEERRRKLKELPPEPENALERFWKK